MHYVVLNPEMWQCGDSVGHALWSTSIARCHECWTFVDEVHKFLFVLQATFGIIKPAEQQQLRELNTRLSTLLLPHRDANGFRKLIVALSASGGHLVP